MDAKMTKQTPGPWKQLGLSPELVVATHAEGHVVHICTVNSHPYETRAINARLIAAAPDLLAARALLSVTSTLGYSGSSCGITAMQC